MYPSPHNKEDQVTSMCTQSMQIACVPVHSWMEFIVMSSPLRFAVEGTPLVSPVSSLLPQSQPPMRSVGLGWQAHVHVRVYVCMYVCTWR